MKNKFADRLLGKVASGFLAILLIVCAVWAIDVNGTQVEAATVTKTDDYVVGTYSYEEIIEYRNKDANGNFGIPTCASEGEWLFAGWFKNAACTSALGSEESPVSGTTYYAKFVSADVLSVKCQVTSGTDTNSPETVLRCVSSVDSLRYKNIGFELELPDGTPKYMQSAKVGKRINAKEGTDAYSYSPKVVDTESEYFYSAVETIKNDNFSDGYIIKPYWITKDGTKVYGVSRYVTVNEYINRNIMYIPVKMDAAPTSPAVTANGSSLTYVTYDANSGYAHFSLATDTSSLKSVTTYAVAGTYNVDKAVSANFTYRNLGTKYQGNDANIDDSWYSSEEDEFVIATSADLYGLAKVVNAGTDSFANKSVYVVCDIEVNKGYADHETLTWDTTKDADGEPFTGETTGTQYPWTRIGLGSKDGRFAGTFDGQMHTISGIYIDGSTTKIGLFADVDANAILKNFQLTNSYISVDDKDYSGSIVGYVNGGTFDSIYSDAIVIGGDDGAGGLFGVIDGGAAFTMNNCWFDGTIASNYRWLGGVIGRITSSSTYSQTITNCLNTGKVTADGSTSKYVGGLIGYSDSANLSISHCLNKGTIGYTGDACVNSTTFCLFAYLTKSTNNSIYATSQTGVENFVGTTTNSDCTVNETSIAGASALTADIKSLFTYVTDSDTDTYANESYWAITQGAPVLSAFADVAGVQYQAVDTSWFRTDKTSFTLKDAADLYGLALLSRDEVADNFTNKRIYLGADIVMNEGITYDENGPKDGTPIEWISIGTYDDPFQGTFDGQGKTISGIYMQADTAYSGLFAAINNTTSGLKGFKLTSSYFDMNSKNYAGSIVGYVYNGSLDSIYSDAFVLNGNKGIGGLCGSVDNAATTFKMNNCWFDGAVTAENYFIGGLLGNLGTTNKSTAPGEITNCLNTGSVNVTADTSRHVGGLFGYNYAPANALVIKNSMNSGEIGYTSDPETAEETITNNTGTYFVIGNTLRALDCSNLYAIYNDDASVKTALPEAFATTDDVSNCISYINDATEGLSIAGAKALTADTKSLFTYVTNDETYENASYWAITQGAPVLSAFANVAGVQHQAVDTSWFRTDETSFTLTDAADLYGLALLSRDSVAGNFANETIYLGADIVMNEGIAYDSNGPKDGATPIEWISIGTSDSTTRFQGNFDGQGKTISGIYLNSTSEYNGLFAFTQGAVEIKNFSLINSCFTSTSSYFGSIVGYANGGTFENIYCDSIVKSAGTNVGGMIGMVKGSVHFVMNNCWFAGEVMNTAGNSTGGLIGRMDSTTGYYRTITNCLNTGDITASSSDSAYVGGLVGYCNVGTYLSMSHCLNVGPIGEGKSDVLTTKRYGAIAGYVSSNATNITAVYTTIQDGLEYAFTSAQNKTATVYSADATLMVDSTAIKEENARTSLSELFESKTTDGEDCWVTTATMPVLKTFSPLAKAILSAKSNATYITATAQEYKQLPVDEGLKNPEKTAYSISGGWTNGTYLYRAFITYYDSNNEDNNEVVIVKYNLTTGEKLLQSDKLPLNHANDITYNKNTNQLVVSHGVSKIVSLIDADSLALVDTKELPRKAGIMDYNPTYDCYAIALAQYHHLYILDKDFNPIKQYEGTLHTHPRFHAKGPAEGVAPQGNTCDDQYIYYLFSSGEKQNYKHVITVFDWSGNYITEIEFQLEDVEPEAISVVDNTIYVMRSKENTVYKISF